MGNEFMYRHSSIYAALVLERRVLGGESAKIEHNFSVCHRIRSSQTHAVIYCPCSHSFSIGQQTVRIEMSAVNGSRSKVS
jgi:hypothetical protein